MSYEANKIDQEIIKLLRSGAVGLLPSDTIYGLSCLAMDEKAVARLHELKKRAADKPFVVLVANLQQLEQLGISAQAVEPFSKFWPGPLTIICPAESGPIWLRGGKRTLAVRCPAYPRLVKLIEKIGPLVSTSANFADLQPASTATEARALFNEDLDFYVDVGRLNEPPSTIVRLSSDKLKIIRQGGLFVRKEDL